jgi:hypothetical protein
MEDSLYNDVGHVLRNIAGPAALALTSAKSLTTFTLRLTNSGYGFDEVLGTKPREIYRELTFDIGAMPSTEKFSKMERLLRSSMWLLSELFHEQSGRAWSGLRNRVSTHDSIPGDYAYLTCTEHATIPTFQSVFNTPLEDFKRKKFKTTTRKALSWNEECRPVWSDWQETHVVEMECDIKKAAR